MYYDVLCVPYFWVDGTVRPFLFEGANERVVTGEL